MQEQQQRQQLYFQYSHVSTGYYLLFYIIFNAFHLYDILFKAEFRVEKKNLHRLAEALQITGTLKCYQGTVFLVWY